MVKTQTASKAKKNSNNAGLFKRGFSVIQRVGKSLLFPIAMLPLAAILLRVGVAIPGTTLFSKFISDAFQSVGNAVFGPALPFMFAMGIAFGMTKDQRGEAAITGMAVMIIMTILMSSNVKHEGGVFGSTDFVDKIYHGMSLNGGNGFHGVFKGAYTNILAHNVFTGIFAGGVVAFLYNRFNGIELPSVLGFFSGRRLIPVLSFMAALVAGLLYAVIFP
ncbi:MAG: PTS transporter subunit EIIC [Chlamydiia bacterium]|nr:PTS transporter subunit EIIC [Chlamydiia bacterium]